MDQVKTPERQPEYKFRQKIRPFLRGMLIGGPLVEVAIEGLRRGVGEPLSSEYESRILKHGSLRHIADAVRCSLGEPLQERMAAAFGRRYGSDQELRSVMYIHGHTGGHPGIVFINVRERLAAHAMHEVLGMMSSGTVTSEAAQAELASIVCEVGRPLHARLMMETGNVTSEQAAARLRARMAVRDDQDV